MRLAVSSRTRDESGNWGDRSNYFDVTVFGRQAETVTTYLTKGRRIGVDGRLSWREWQANDGSKRQNVEVVASDIFFLDSRSDSAAGGGGDQSRSGWGDSSGAGAGDADLPVDQSDMSAPATTSDDEIPF